MAQTSVSSFYNTRKSLRNRAKETNDSIKSVSLTTIHEDGSLKLQKAQQWTKTSQEADNKKDVTLQLDETSIVPVKKEKSQTVKGNSNLKKQPRNTKAAKKVKAKQTTVTSYYTKLASTNASETNAATFKKDNLPEKAASPEPVSSNVALSPKRGPCLAIEVTPTKEKAVISSKDVAESKCIELLPSIAPSPKRGLAYPIDVTPTKKKAIVQIKGTVDDEGTSQQQQTNETCTRRKLDMGPPPSPSKISMSVHSPVKGQVRSPWKVTSPLQDKKISLVGQSRSEQLLNLSLGSLKKMPENLSKKMSMLKRCQASPHQIASVVGLSKTLREISAEPKSYAHEKFSHLTASDPLVLPLKYKLLSEMFRDMDTVVSMMYNRKEKITFQKVSEGVQNALKRSFLKHHLGQIVAVLPSAYSITLEKCGFMNKEKGSQSHQLIITPILYVSEGKESKKSKSSASMKMYSKCLIDRSNEFNKSLLELVKQHHKDFLDRIRFPVPKDAALKRWHPKFPVDSVPDIKPAQLPEPPESKIYTAKDVLNKVRGTTQSKVEKALQSVADESKGSDVTIELKDINNPKPETSKAALKGICSDLLAKIRERESAKLLGIMTRTPDETKRLAMLERLPKIVNILWHFFIAERKFSVPIDAAVEKIQHSFGSLTTPDTIKEHLKLITETFPGWLTFIEIPKGVYVQIDKQRNIYEMLDNLKH